MILRKRKRIANLINKIEAKEEHTKVKPRWKAKIPITNI
jgi:hypothetical protein